MSFRIKSSHKFTEMFPKSQAAPSEDYLLFDIDNKTSAKPIAKPRTGGNYIRSTNSAQADFY
jgi:hypothetical protein